MRRKWVKPLAVLVLAVVLFGVVKGILGFLHIRRDLDLVAAAGTGRTSDVRELLARGANPNATHIEGSSALWWAVSSGNYSTVKVLLDSGANPNSTGQYGSVISQALNQLDQAKGTAHEESYKAIVKELIAKGAVVPKGAGAATSQKQHNQSSQPTSYAPFASSLRSSRG